MQINDIEFNAELIDILTELQTQLHVNGIPLLNKIKDVGNDIMVTCPYHKNGQERRPSAGFRKSDGTFHCLACGEVHSLQEVITHCFNMNSVGGMWGWTWLLRNFATIETRSRKDIQLDFTRTKNIEVAESDVVTEQELDSYRYFHPYMYERKLTDEVIELFDIGYDRETECLTFPVRDINGDVLFIARRSVKTKFFNYPQGVDKPLYGLYEYNLIRNQAIKNLMGMKVSDLELNVLSELIVCESMLDALTAWAYGKPAVALNGLGSELQFKQLMQLPVRKLILATDNDDAGLKARKRIRERIDNKIITEYVLPIDKKDLNELSKEEFENLEEIF